jgi:YegS/Rv2252/BmrU family lipid kinase
VPGPLVIVNPSAGGGRAGRLTAWLAERLLRIRDGELALTRERGHATTLARQAAADGRDRIVGVGGDGTIQEIVEGVIGAPSPPSVGIVPAGRGNDLARSIGLPREREEAWRVALAGDPRPLDVGRATSGNPGRTQPAGGVRHFVSAGGIGFDAQVALAMSRRRRWQHGSMGYLLTVLDELRHFENRSVRLTIDGEAPRDHVAFLLAITNGSYYGAGMRICPEARPDDGWLDICLVGDISWRTAVAQLPNLYRGRHVTHPAVTMLRARRVRVDGGGEALAHLDGEPFGSLPVEIEVVPGAVDVAVALPPARATT